MSGPLVVALVFDAPQDVSLLRPLAFLARREFGRRTLLLVSEAFIESDLDGVSQREIALVAAEADGAVHVFASPLEAYAALEGRHGVIFTAGEARRPGDTAVRDLLRVAPAGFLRATLQDGYESAGFAHGHDVRFVADVLCGWGPAEASSALGSSERPKLLATGPAAALNAFFPGPAAPAGGGGIACEGPGPRRDGSPAAFLGVFSEFCGLNAPYGVDVNLRPDPERPLALDEAGRLGDNVVLQPHPLHAMPLGDFDFAIAPPASILVDFILAGVPVAVWRDASGPTADAYAGLLEVRGASDWMSFARDAVLRPAVALGRQRAFLDSRRMIFDSDEIYVRFARLIAASETISRPVESSHWPHQVAGAVAAMAEPLGAA